MPLEALRSAAHVTVDAKSLAVGDGGNEVPGRSLAMVGPKNGMYPREKSWDDLWEARILIYDIDKL